MKDDEASDGSDDDPDSASDQEDDNDDDHVVVLVHCRLSKREEREDLHRVALVLTANQLPPGWQLVQSSTHARVAHSPEKALYYKEFLPRSPAESLKALLRGSRATRARRHNDTLRNAGII